MTDKTKDRITKGVLYLLYVLVILLAFSYYGGIIYVIKNLFK